LEWRDLSYCVLTPKGPKALLRGVSGSVCGGQMMALMGASGAGESGCVCLCVCVCVCVVVGGGAESDGWVLNWKNRWAYPASHSAVQLFVHAVCDDYLQALNICAQSSQEVIVCRSQLLQTCMQARAPSWSCSPSGNTPLPFPPPLPHTPTT